MSSGGGSGSDQEEKGEEKKFFAEHAKSGRATCKGCKDKIEHGALRLGKAAFNPFGPGPAKQWFHVACLFDVFKRQRPATARIHTPDDVDGWSDLDDDDRAAVLKHLPALNADDYKCGKKKERAPETPKTPKGSKKGKGAEAKAREREKEKEKKAPSAALAALAARSVPAHKDNAFREFRRLCVQVAGESAYSAKTAAVKRLFDAGTAGDGFKGDLRLWVKLLLPGAVKRVYNLQSKQLVKLFSRILRQNQDDMLEDLENGDVAETISTFFKESKHCCPARNSHLTIQEVDSFLEELSQITKEDDQSHLFTQIAEKCTSNDLMYVIRLVKHDLRINAGPKHILEAIHPDAYLAFQTSRDLDAVLENVFSTTKNEEKGSSKSLNITVKIMTPVLPMLAEACKSIEHALKKCPNGMLSEIKYDGERVQVHKSGSEFKYFSRSLKPVMPHKIKEFKDYIPKAFPGGEDLILDSEILMIDTSTGQPLPFGTLGIHKKGECKDACVCLFVFDCIYYNGKSLLHMPMRKRRKILHENMTEIKNRIMFSETQEVHTAKDLESMMTKVFQMGLEGLVLKDLESVYEPGKRHWLKVKKDYLFGGAMADTADLVVLGAWFGTGQKGGMMSVFLMGCWDSAHKQWCTVTKVHTGHDDKTLERLQKELQMEKISKEADRVPSWLKCTKTMIPDFVAKNPKEMPVWEITGAEFTQHDVHTAAGISIRFPRVTRIRSDKTWKTATSLSELKDLFKKSKDSTDFCFPSHFQTDDVCSESESSKKRENADTRDESDSSQLKLDSNLSSKRKSEKDKSPKRKSRKNGSPGDEFDREGSRKESSSRDNSPNAQSMRDTSPKSIRSDSPKPKHSEGKFQKSKSGRNTSQKHKRTNLINSDKSGSDDEISDESNEKQNKSLKGTKLSKRNEEELNDELEEPESNSQGLPAASSSSKAAAPEQFRKRKGSASSGADQPVKRMKVEDSRESVVAEESGTTSTTELLLKRGDDRTNSESFIKLLVSEMHLIRHPVLLCKVKGQLLELIRKAQEEQIKLDADKCECNCEHCYAALMSKVKNNAETSGRTPEAVNGGENMSLLSNTGSNEELVAKEENGTSQNSMEKIDSSEKLEAETDSKIEDEVHVEKLEKVSEGNNVKESVCDNTSSTASRDNDDVASSKAENESSVVDISETTEVAVDEMQQE